MRRRRNTSGQDGLPSASAAADESTSNHAPLADSTYASAASFGSLMANLSQHLPLNLLQFPFQNPNANLAFASNPAFLLQNPAFLPNPNPSSNPGAVFPNPNRVIPNAALPNPNESSSAPQSASQAQKWLLKKAADLTEKAHEELLSAGECISGYKVARNVLASLGADSWESLGIQMKDVAALHQIFKIEGRVSDFASCFVMTRGVVTLYELEAEICKNEGVDQFENLMLGPFLRHPIVTRYFFIPSDHQKPVKLFTEDVITYLGEILDEPNRSVVVLDELLTYIAKKKKVDRAEKLGVRIKDLGNLVRYIHEARRGEQEILQEVTKKFHDTNTEGKTSGDRKRTSKSERMANSESAKKCAESSTETIKRKRLGKRERAKDDIDSKEKSRFSSEKKKLDNRFTHISSKFSTFKGLSQKNTFKGKHTRFISSDEESDADSSDEEERSKNVNLERNPRSTCPYPSTTEELARLKLQSDPRHKLGKSVGNESSRKERKQKALKVEEEPLGNVSSKKERKRKAIAAAEESVGKENSIKEEGKHRVMEAEMENLLLKKSSKRRRILATDGSEHLTLCQSDLEKFIAIWKEPCRMRSISEVVELMQTIYNIEKKDRKKMKWLFSIFPCIGLLNVAVNAIRNGSSDSLYDTMQALGENEGPVVSSEPSDVVIKVGHSKKDKEVTDRQVNTKVGIGVEEIIKKITHYFEANHSCLHNRVISVKTLFHCGTWVSNQLFVDEFTALGHGNFLAFLHQHTPLLPPKLQSIFSEEVNKSCSSLVSMHERQLGMLLSQAGSVKRKSDILHLLMKQFPTMSLCLSGNDIEKMEFIEKPSGILFSHTLLPHCTNDDGQKSEFSLVSSSEALECLLKAPFLSDLLSWSHWEHVFAPSLGSFFDWYLAHGCIGDLVCIATRDGRFIRVESSATADQFLEAFIQLSPFLAAVKLLSLLYHYGGSSNMPVSLLKLYAERAAGALVRISNDSAQGNTITDQAIPDIDSRVCAIAGFILNCLGHLPSEFWAFAAVILLSGLQSVTKDVPIALLCECITSRQRFMLHDIGLSLGIVEWVEDYRQFILNGVVLLKGSPSSFEKSTYGNSNRISGVVSKASTAKLGAGSVLMDHNATDLNSNTAYCELAIDAVTHPSDETPMEALNFIEAIRREEFGLDPNLSATESGLLKKQHARLGRALHCLSQELYSQDSHLLLELVQNADDNIYPQSVEPTLVFILQETGIVVLNNEVGFTAQNIKALCDVGNSTKKGSNAGYIGNKGIGFKSVFRVTDAPEIHSNGFHIKFDISEGQIGFVLPTVVAPRDIGIFSCLLPAEDGGALDFSHWNTCIVLPFRKKSDKSQADMFIMSMFADLHPSLLLFLHRIQCIKFKSTIDGAYRAMRKQYIGHGIVRVSDGSNKMNWLVVSKKLSCRLIRPDVQTTEIALAFTLEEVALNEYQPSLVHQPVFAFLPLRNYGLKFILQGDFVLPTSREEVDSNSAWNQWLLSEYPSLFVAALGSFSNLPCFRDYPGKSVSAFMSFVPLVGEVHGFFSGLPHMIITMLQTACCMILDVPGSLQLVPPCRVLRGWTEQVRLLIPDILLEKSIGLGYLSRDIELSDQLARALGIRDYGPRVLYDAVSTLFVSKDAPEDWRGMDWLSAWLVTLHSALLAHSSVRHFDDPGLVGDILDSLRKMPFIPLSDGSCCSVSEGDIWLPYDVSGAGFENQYGVKEFPLLYASLRTINPQLLTALNSNKYLVHEGRTDDLTEMLLKIGVKKLSAHEIIRSHIIPALSASIKGCDANKALMVEYLAYVMLHFQSACAVCPSQKAEILLELRNKSVLLTNLGCVSLSSTPVHFGKEYGGTIDMNRFIGMELNWCAVDTAYLKHPSTQHLPTVSHKWRDFLKELGVTDFISVTQVQRILSDNASVITDWVSMELVRILSVLSIKKSRTCSIYLLEVLDKLWDESYSDKVLMGDKKDGSSQSSFVKSLHEVRWIASSTDEELHYPRDLFYDCADVRSLLGANAPYALPQITSKSLLKEVGFKTEVLPGEALSILTSWAKTQNPFKASVDQMSRLYNYISEGISSSMLSLNQSFLESRFIFTPFQGSLSSEISLGEMLSPKEVYWLDPTGCFEMIKELNFAKKSKCHPCRMLAAIYPGLHHFFVTRSGVPELPSFTKYADILLELSNIALAKKASHLVARVIMSWVKDIESKVAKYDDILKLKELLHKAEYKVLPTVRGKWVSLHASFGSTYWVDDEKLMAHFYNAPNVNFLQFPELEGGNDRNIALFMQSLGIPAISKVVSREVVHYELVKDAQKACLINWALPYVQRYLYKMHPLKYVSFKELEKEALSLLKVIMSRKLYYKYSLNGLSSTSQDRFEASAILKENILYLTPDVDSHAMYLELSRLFFDGSTNLQFANFLLMITTMAESGSTSEQIDFFLMNSQNMSKVPTDDPIWALSPKLNPVMNPLPLACHYNTASRLKPGLGVSYLFNSSVNEITPLSPEDDDQSKEVLIPIEVETDWITEKDLASSSEPEQPLSNEPVVSSSPNLQVLGSGTNVPAACANQPASTASISAADTSNKCQVVVPSLVDRNRFNRWNQENAQNLRTGRLGEMVAYKYFADQIGPGRVRWVNEQSETGLPYDIVIDGDREETKEYVEVKATLYSRKDWFSITMREWQFACEKGEAFTIAHVILMSSGKASVIVLKNLYKLIMQHTLRLAVFMSGLHRDSLAEAEGEV